MKGRTSTYRPTVVNRFTFELSWERRSGVAPDKVELRDNTVPQLEQLAKQ